MKSVALLNLALCATALLAGCGELVPSAQTSLAGRGSHASSTTLAYRVLHRFGGLRHKVRDTGSFPLGGLTNVNGTLFGTTGDGGTGGVGTVYSISPTGEKKTLYNFRGGGADGAYPRGDLIDVDGTLYGTTNGGGSSCAYTNYGRGTVYSVTTSGAEKVLYSFHGASDGANPYSGLIELNGTLYGTTRQGGGKGCSFSNIHGCGTVYSITTLGQETVLYHFQGADGAYPIASLVAVKGALYGTTLSGGTCGNVFKVTTAGSETVVHSFNCYSEGADPAATLIYIKGELYGTTSRGGSSSLGTVFSMTTSGSEKVLYNFAGAGDGAIPEAGLAYLNGAFYGTTYVGGSSACPSLSYGSGCGTVYRVDATGSEKIVHLFQGGSDGAQPLAPLLSLSGTLYGTTIAGGGLGCKGNGLRANGCGTVFTLSP